MFEIEEEYNNMPIRPNPYKHMDTPLCRKALHEKKLTHTQH